MGIDNIDNLGHRLAIERSRFNLSQPELGLIIDADKQTVYRYETNQRIMKADQLEKLLAHGFDVMYILSGKRAQEKEALLEPEQEWLQLLLEVDPNQKQTLITMVKNFVASFPSH